MNYGTLLGALSVLFILAMLVFFAGLVASMSHDSEKGCSYTIGSGGRF